MNPFNLVQVFGAGKSLVHIIRAKRGQLTLNIVAPLLAFAASFLKGTPYEIPDALLQQITVGVMGIGNYLLTVASTDKIDILGRAGAVPAGPGEPASGAGPSTAAQPAQLPGALAAQPAAPVEVQPGSGGLTRQDDDAVRAGG